MALELPHELVPVPLPDEEGLGRRSRVQALFLSLLDVHPVDKLGGQVEADLV